MAGRQGLVVWGAMSALLVGCSGQDPRLGSRTETPTAPATASPAPPAPASGSAPPRTPNDGSAPREVVSGLSVPWGMDLLPDGTGVVVERDSGAILLLPPPDAGLVRTAHRVGTVAVDPGSESGLLGLAVSPRFGTDHRLFVYASTSEDNRVLRLELSGTGPSSWSLSEPTPILTGIPTAEFHSGGRLAFGPLDGHLYISTGDTRDAELAQDRDSLAGKILRITTDGDPAPGNPFGTAVWSWGHRNVQGLAFDAEGQLWASEFGESRWDELNRIVPGGNYGWPYREGRERELKNGTVLLDFIEPQVVWPTDDASPSGLTFWKGSLWMASLRGERLWEIPLSDGKVGTPVAHLVGDVGRLRSVLVAPGNHLWVSTSNTDGRGDPGPEDDRILQVD